MQKQRIKLLIAGALATVTLSADLKVAHGTGLDGKTQVKSLKIGDSPDHPGKLFIQDVHGNNILTTADELFAAIKIAARTRGFEVTATKITT